MRGKLLVESGRFISVRKCNMNIGVFQPEARVDVRSDFVIRFEDVLDVYINKIVERVYVLFNKTLHFEKGGQKQPLVLIVIEVRDRMR